ncbi:MAG: DUF58 domain-containing protein [Myxococcales bacterium]|nr:DUF58 domain-containing protein [Myxococcales bacterium]
MDGSPPTDPPKARAPAPSPKTSAPAGAPKGSKRAKQKRRRRLPARTFQFTRQGKLFLLVTFGVGLAAVNTGNNLLYLVLGLMLSLLLVSGTLSDVALWRVKIRRTLPKRAFVGQPMVVELLLENGKGVPAYAVEVEDLAADEVRAERRCFFLKVDPRVTRPATYRRTPARRGWLRFERIMTRTRYPFGLIEKGRRVTAPGELLVYPRLVPVDLRAVLAGATGHGAPDRKRGRGEVDGLRDHRDGDEARSIHWLRTAALDRVVVRERSAEARARLAVVLDDARPPLSDADAALWDEGFEAAVSEAASIAHAAHGAGVAVEVHTRSGGTSLVQPGEPLTPVLRFLALVTPAATTAPLPSPRGAHVHRVAVALADAPPTEVAA